MVFYGSILPSHSIHELGKASLNNLKRNHYFKLTILTFSMEKKFVKHLLI
jgi:hypothetical protein